MATGSEMVSALDDKVNVSDIRDARNADDNNSNTKSFSMSIMQEASRTEDNDNITTIGLGSVRKHHVVMASRSNRSDYENNNNNDNYNNNNNSRSVVGGRDGMRNALVFHDGRRIGVGRTGMDQSSILPNTDSRCLLKEHEHSVGTPLRTDAMDILHSYRVPTPAPSPHTTSFPGSHVLTTKVTTKVSVSEPRTDSMTTPIRNNRSGMHPSGRSSLQMHMKRVAASDSDGESSSPVSTEPSSLDTSSASTGSSSTSSAMNTSRSGSSLNTSEIGHSLNTSRTGGSLNSSQNSGIPSLNCSTHNACTESNSTNITSGSTGSAQPPSSIEEERDAQIKAETSAVGVTLGDPRQRQVFEILTGIQNLRRSGNFSDVIIRVQEEEFRCHRFVLANSSQFFVDLLSGEQSNMGKGETESKGDESQQGSPDDDASPIHSSFQQTTHNDYEKNHTTDNFSNDNILSYDDVTKNNTTDYENKNDEGDKINDDNNNVKENESGNTRCDETQTTTGVRDGVFDVSGVDPQVFHKVLDFLYCQFDDVITDSTAVPLLLAANMFQLPYLSQTCVTHIADTLAPSNVYDVIRLVDTGSPGLTDQRVKLRCHQVFRENFLQLSRDPNFLSLSRSRIISLVADSMLAIRGEMDLIPPLIRWVEAKPWERSADLTLMLQLIRFPLIAAHDLDKLKELSVLKENSLAKALIEESRTYSISDFPHHVAWPRQNCISRVHFPSRDFILWTADRDKGLHLYSIIDGRHYKVTTFTEATMDKMGFTLDSTSSVCAYGHRLFFTGGEFKTDLAWSIDTDSGEVSIHSKMPRGRKGHSMVVSKGCLYCLGGQDKRGYTVLDTVDAYVISKDLWVKVGHMAVAAYNMAAVVSGGAIYMIGGVDHCGQPLRVVQCFAVLRSGLYSSFQIQVANMPPSLLSPRAVTSGMDGIIYIVCGHGEVYRLETDKQSLHHVHTLNSLNKNPRFRFGLAHVGGCLVAIGGHQLGQTHVRQDAVRSVCMDIATKAEVKDYSPLLPADIINTCFYAKLSSGILGHSKLSNPGL